MPLFYWYLLLAWSLCIASTVGMTEKYPSDDQLRAYEGYIRKMMRCRNVPAMSITLVKGDSFVWSKGFGMADRANKIPATDKTRFCIGSLSKAFTATILGKLLSKQNNITWDTPIRQILGDDFRFSDALRTEIANLRDILAHRMGVPSYFNALLSGFTEDVSRKDLVRRVRYMDATSPIRTDFMYNNYMYSLAGYIAEVIGGKSWEELVRQNIFLPLGMDSSGFVDEEKEFKNFALPYVTLNGKLVNISKHLMSTVSPAGPAGSIISSAADMAKWINFHINTSNVLRTQGHLPRGLSALSDTYSGQMHGAFTSMDITEPKYPVHDVNIAYAFGWVTSIYRGYRKIWHSGGITSYTSGLWIFPDVRAGLFISMSGPVDRNKRPAVQAATFYAADLLLGKTPWINMSTVCNFPSSWEQAHPPMNGSTERYISSNKQWLPLAEYTGTYGHLAFGNITVTLNEKNDSIVLQHGRFGSVLLKSVLDKPDIFEGMYTGELWYVTGSDDALYSSVKVKFKRKHDSVDVLEYPIAVEKLSVFVKGLKLSDTPGTCSAQGSIHHTNGIKEIHTYMFIYFIIYNLIYNQIYHLCVLYE